MWQHKPHGLKQGGDFRESGPGFVLMSVEHAKRSLGDVAGDVKRWVWVTTWGNLVKGGFLLFLPRFL